MLLHELNEVQRKEIMRQVGNPQGMSPEGLEHAIEQYINSLKHQAKTAQAFFFGELEEGFGGLYELPDDVRIQIDQLIWEAAGNEAIDPTEQKSQSLIASAILHSMELRMGMHE